MINNKIVLLCTVLWLYGCNAHAPTEAASKDEIDQILAEAPVFPGYTCQADMGLKVGYSTWKDAGIKVIYYYIDNWPLRADTGSMANTFRYVMASWEHEIGMPVRRTRIKDTANIVIRWTKLDGIGRYAGVGESPPMDTHDRKQIYLTLDLYDWYANRSDYNFILTALHESGHNVGVEHSDDKESVMYPAPTPNIIKKKLAIDDVAAARIAYGRAGVFSYDGVNYIPIHKGDRKKITKNFTAAELWTTCSNYGYKYHWISQQVVYGLQIIRDFYQCPIRITSNYRNATCNAVKAKATLSQHIQFNAVDFVFIGNAAQKTNKVYTRDILRRGPLFKLLYSAGIRGYGSYDNGSFHIDCRKKYYCEAWDGKPLCAWGRFNQHFGPLIPEEKTED